MMEVLAFRSKLGSRRRRRSSSSQSPCNMLSMTAPNTMTVTTTKSPEGIFFDGTAHNPSSSLNGHPFDQLDGQRPKKRSCDRKNRLLANTHDKSSSSDSNKGLGSSPLPKPTLVPGEKRHRRAPLGPAPINKGSNNNTVNDGQALYRLTHCIPTATATTTPVPFASTSLDFGLDTYHTIHYSTQLKQPQSPPSLHEQQQTIFTASTSSSPVSATISAPPSSKYFDPSYSPQHQRGTIRTWRHLQNEDSTHSHLDPSRQSRSSPPSESVSGVNLSSAKKEEEEELSKDQADAPAPAHAHNQSLLHEPEQHHHLHPDQQQTSEENKTSTTINVNSDRSNEHFTVLLKEWELRKGGVIENVLENESWYEVEGDKDSDGGDGGDDGASCIASSTFSRSSSSSSSLLSNGPPYSHEIAPCNTPAILASPSRPGTGRPVVFSSRSQSDSLAFGDEDECDDDVILNNVDDDIDENLDLLVSSSKPEGDFQIPSRSRSRSDSTPTVVDEPKGIKMEAWITPSGNYSIRKDNTVQHHLKSLSSSSPSFAIEELSRRLGDEILEDYSAVRKYRGGTKEGLPLTSTFFV